MKIFLSSVEGSQCENVINTLIDDGVQLHYNLMSFYYIKNKNASFCQKVRDHSELVLIDSGAHSFQFGKKVDWVEYTKNYAKFIQFFDRPNVLGYFEMDIENIIGYEKVKKLRKILTEVSDKIIPVWHPDRGIEDYHAMCEEYANKVVAIGGFRQTDIKDEQYLMFLKVAKKYGCKVHCLGMTRFDVLDKVPFDYTDSSTWLKQTNFGNIYWSRMPTKKLPKSKNSVEKQQQLLLNYKQGIAMQEYYYKKWRRECKD